MKSPRSERGSATGSHKSRKRSSSRDGDRRHSRRDRPRDSLDTDDAFRASGGDYYRGGGRARTRSRSPDDDRYYRPGGRSRRDRDEREEDKLEDKSHGRRDRNGVRKRTPSPKRARSKEPTPQLTEDERDRRTVFVQQLAARLRTKELIAFFEKVGPVKEAQIVKDRVSGRSKGYDPSLTFCRYFTKERQSRLCRIQARRIGSSRNPAYRPKASRNSHYCSAHRGREESASSQSGRYHEQ